MTTHAPTVAFSGIDCLDIDVQVQVANGRGLICPASQGGEAAWAGGIEVLAPASLLGLINHFKGTQVLSPPVAAIADHAVDHMNLKDIKGQESAKRALEVAAAGGHTEARGYFHVW